MFYGASDSCRRRFLQHAHTHIRQRRILSTVPRGAACTSLLKRYFTICTKLASAVENTPTNTLTPKRFATDTTFSFWTLFCMLRTISSSYFA